LFRQSQNPIQRAADAAAILQEQAGTTTKQSEFYAAAADSLKMLAGSVDGLSAMLNAGHQQNWQEIQRLAEELRKLKESLQKTE
jgi:hypothetical protein